MRIASHIFLAGFRFASKLYLFESQRHMYYVKSHHLNGLLKQNENVFVEILRFFLRIADASKHFSLKVIVVHENLPIFH